VLPITSEWPEQQARRLLLPLLREIGDSKRVTSAGRRGSIAERLFRRAWSSLLAGGSADEVALAITARALAATRLADLDGEALLDLGLEPAEARRIDGAALAEFAGLLPDVLLQKLDAALARDPLAFMQGADLPFVDALAGQPRAGVTCPGRPRIVLQPPENHAEHCLVVAVYAVLLAEPGTDLGTAFLAALAHHLHNAAMPDAGFTGEMLLGAHLEPVMARATERALDDLPPALREMVVAARRILPDAGSPEGRAFHTADVLDLEHAIEQHLRAASLTMETVLGEMALVHDGPVKPFHDGVLAEFGLA
jgi:5'-deoxynucleotidase YfbR-like HD superfamily hydrolase